MGSGNASILVVDDEEVIRDLMTDILNGEGYEVESVPDALHALARLKEQHEFIVLFTDIMMPEMDGIELIREARSVSPEVIPIVMTGYATLETARAAVREGAYDYVLKPFSLGEIKLAVSNAIERHQLIHDNARLRDLTELFKISEKISGFHEESPLLDFVIRAALERVGAFRGSIMLTTSSGHALRVAASVGLPEEAANSVANFGRSISGWVAQNCLPLCVQDISKNPDMLRMSHGTDSNSFISIPLERNLMVDIRSRDGQGRPRVIAVLNVSHKKDGLPFTEGDLTALSIVAKHASVALENVHLFENLESAHLDTLKSMALVIEAKDPYTHGHSERVRNLSVAAAIKLGMPKQDVETLRLGAMLHDVGKIGVSDAILNKASLLTSKDWDAIKTHPVVGYEVLEPVSFLTPDHLTLVRSHHERLDGSGYPDGLKGDAIDDRVRVLSVADSYDAMSSDRAYRTGISPREIVTELKQYAGEKLDANIVSLFVEMIESGEIEQSSSREMDSPGP